MNKNALGLLLLVFPVLAMASGDSLSFAPPPTDYSVVFLANIFGIVDGVLHGSGSQIMGNMFGVFNAAVLALGGIVITYTLLVSTVNTAHEGQMLGQKWSSMWVPVRATLGLALLIPKASGYCMMQIFVMWVVVQGVGAADKVWNSALSYLNRGGVVVQQQINPITSITGGNTDIASGASTILSGQVCMLGLQQILTKTRQSYLNQQNNQSGPCYVPQGQQADLNSPMSKFCNMQVPSFINSFDAIAVQNLNTSPNANNNVPLPNFDITQWPYNSLNGICGTVTWAPFNVSSLGAITTLGQGEIDTMKKSRSIAVQQMYMDLSTVAQIMVNNNPILTPQNTGAGISGTTTGISVFAGTSPSSSGSGTSSGNQPATPMAQQAFGVPMLNTGGPCTSYSVDCTGWGVDGSMMGGALFNGTEFQGAVSDYNAIMLPTLNLVNQASNSAAANQQRAFIQAAEEQGWIVAGSYFFDLVSINNANMTTGGVSEDGTPTDTDSQLQQSTFDPATMTSPFGSTGCTGPYANLCVWMQGVSTDVDSLSSFFAGSNSDGASAISAPNVNPLTAKAVSGPTASTVFGFINNSVLIVLPGQPGNTAPQFVMKLIPNILPPKLELPKIDFPCWKFFICWGKLLGAIFYDLILKVLLMFVLNFVNALVNLIVVACLILPLQGMSKIFLYGVSFLQQPNINPVVALANMGVNFINFANDMWLYVIDTAIIGSIFGPFVMTIIALIMPLLLAWMGTMVALGFVTAYYVPFLPYMIFTFGAIGWLMAVIEAMVAAPIVALGITHPEGEGPFGKGEQAIMILMNVFLRPALMIVGYIAAIILSYVGIWVINAGFSRVVMFIQGDPNAPGLAQQIKNAATMPSTPSPTNQMATSSVGYGGWAGIYGFFFSILIYTTMYLTVVQKSFTLITSLPDKVLRWIGGQPETIGGETAGWAEDVKRQLDKPIESSTKAAGQMSKQLSGKVLDKGGMKSPDQPDIKSTPMPPDE